MKTIIALLLLPVLLLCGCDKNAPPGICTEEEYTKEGYVVSVTGPTEMNTGETAALIVSVMNDTTLCVKEADAVIEDVNKSNTVHINASLVHTGPRSSSTCNCEEGKTIQTLVYFNPTVSGIYTFGYRYGGSYGEFPSTDRPFIITVK